MSSYINTYPQEEFDPELLERIYGIELGNAPIPNFLSSSKVFNLLVPFFQNRPVVDDLKASKAVRFFKITALIGAVLARIPLIPLSINIDARLKGLGTTCVIFNIVAFSSFLAWSSNHLIDQVFYSLKTLEPQKNRSCQKCRTITLIVVSLLSGLASQVPYLFLADKYNPDNKRLLVVTAFDIIPPVYSIYLSLNEVFKKSTNSHILQKVLKIKKYLLSRLDIRLQEIINGKILVSRYDNLLQSEQSYQDTMNAFFQELVNEQIDIPSLNPCMNWTKWKIAQILGAFLIATQLFWTGYLSFQGVNKITSNPIAIGITFIYVVICNLALTRLIMIGSVYKMINSLGFYCNQDCSYNYISERLRPNLGLFLSCLVFIVSLAALAPAFTLSFDFLNPQYSIYSTMAYGLSLAAMNGLTLKNLVDTSICHLLSQLGTDEEKKELKMYAHYKGVRKIIQNSSLDSLAIFLHKMSDDQVFIQILNRYSLSVEDLIGLHPAG